MGDAVLVEICKAVAPACSDSARAAGDALARRGQSLGNLEPLARRLAGARHSVEPDVSRKHVIVCAGDHAVPGPATGTNERDATLRAARQIVAGNAAVNAMARTAGAAVLVIDCGMAVESAGDPGIVDLRIGAGTADIRQGPAMPVEAALLAIQTGVAFMLSLADSGTDCVALGQLADHSGIASGALVVALTSQWPADLEPSDRAAIETALDVNRVATDDSRSLEDDAARAQRAVELLAALGGHEIAAMVGIILAAASLRVPVVLDEHGTSAAALVARYLAPRSAGYLIASHIGRSASHRAALGHLELSALFDLGLAYGEGTGSALALPLIDSAAQLLRRRSES